MAVDAPRQRVGIFDGGIVVGCPLGFYEAEGEGGFADAAVAEDRYGYAVGCGWGAGHCRWCVVGWDGTVWFAEMGGIWMWEINGVSGWDGQDRYG